MRMAVRSFLLWFCVGAPLAAGESPIALPLLDRSATAAALGEGGAHLSGLDALEVNPAGLAGTAREWNATYRQMPLEISLNGMAFAQQIRSLRTTVAVSYTTLRSVNMERRGVDGQRAGTFRHEEQMMGLHVARPFHRSDKTIEVGAAIKSIQSRIASYSGTGLAMDVGVRARWKALPLTYSASILNFGEGPKLLSQKSELPTSCGVSLAYQALDDLTVLGGAAHFPKQDMSSATFGVEYTLRSFFTVRGHYALGTKSDGRTGWGKMVGGFGLKLGNLKLDYAFQPAGDEFSEAGVSGTQHATLAFAF
jgi:hypothetical protein